MKMFYPKNIVHEYIDNYNYGAPTLLSRDEEDISKGIEKAFDSLTERGKQIMDLRYKEYKSLKEIGTTVGLSAARIGAIIREIFISKHKSPVADAYLQLGYRLGRQYEEIYNYRMGYHDVDYKSEFCFVDGEYLRNLPEKKFVYFRNSEYGYVNEDGIYLCERWAVLRDEETGVEVEVLNRLVEFTYFRYAEVVNFYRRWLTGEDLFECIPDTVENKELYFVKFVSLCEICAPNFDYDSCRSRYDVVARVIKDFRWGWEKRLKELCETGYIATY